jgi:5-oxoprolinase (ATP-hydrolysing)
MTRILAHPLAGVLSAYGMGLADPGALRQRALELLLEDAAMSELRAALDALADQARAIAPGSRPWARQPSCRLG